MDFHDVGMVHPRLEAGLEQQTLGVARVLTADELHGHCALEPQVPGAVDFAHPTSAEQALELDATVEG